MARSNTLVMPSLLAVAKCLPSGDTAIALRPSFDTNRGVAGPLWGLEDKDFKEKLLLVLLASFPCSHSNHHSVTTPAAVTTEIVLGSFTAYQEHCTCTALDMYLCLEADNYCYIAKVP